MNKNRTCPPEFIGENRDPRRYPAPNTPPKPKFIDALEITDDAEQYSTPVKKDPKTGLLYSNAEFLRAESDRYHVAEEERLDDLIDEEAKNRYNHVMAIDEINQYRLNEEKMARESQDVILGDRIDRHEVKVNELHVEANKVHNSKLDKNFSNAEISTLPVSPSDYVVIVSNGNTYRVTLEQLKVLLTSSIDYFKGIHATLKALQTAHPTGKPGDYAFVEEDANNTDKFVMYVWDEAQEEGQWEETTSSQFATQADYTALVQSLLDGTFNLGSVKANSSPEESPLLKSLHVNQRDYSLPSVELEFSDDVVEGANDLNSITINGNVWNIPKYNVELKLSSKHKKDAMLLGSITINDDVWNLPNNMVKVKFSSRLAGGANELKSITMNGEAWNINDDFLSFGIGRKFDKGFVFDQTYAEDPTKVSDIYRFEAYTGDELMGYYTIQFNKNVEGKFYYRFDKHDGTQSGYGDSPTLTVGGSFDYWVLIEIIHETGVRLGTTLEERFASIENKIQSGGGSGGIKSFTRELARDEEDAGIGFLLENDDEINSYFNSLPDGKYTIQINTTLRTSLRFYPSNSISLTIIKNGIIIEPLFEDDHLKVATTIISPVESTYGFYVAQVNSRIFSGGTGGSSGNNLAVRFGTYVNIYDTTTNITGTLRPVVTGMEMNIVIYPVS